MPFSFLDRFSGSDAAMESNFATNMPGTPRQPRGQPRRLRSRRVKTFSGCMTCRSRHLKCDETRPVCRRCSNANLECAGYPGYRSGVQWKPVRGLSDFGVETDTPIDGEDGHTSRHQLEAATSQRDSESRTPISYPQHPSPETPREAEATQSEPASTCTSPPIPTNPQEIISPTNGSSAPLLLVPSIDKRTHHARELRSLEQDEEHSRNIPPCSVPRLLPPPDHRGSSPECRSARRHIDLLFPMSLQLRCVEYWITHLSDALSSVPGSMSPLKRIFVPIIYAGAMSPATSSTGSVVLFYLVSSASAFHLSVHLESVDQKSEFLTLALSHQNQGIRHLQHHLAVDDPSQRESVLASLLLCMTYEPITVKRNFWLTHLRGASQWLHKVNVTSWAHDESTITMYQMLVSTATMLRSQILSEEVAQDGNFHFEMETMLEPYYLHHVFGLPKKSLKMMSDMIAMAVRLHQYGEEPPLDLERFETELYLSIPPDCHIPAATRGQEDLVHHYAQIFYFGSIIYCKRRLRGLLLADVQPLVEQAIDHIEALANYKSRPYSPILWPVAMAFFEVQDILLRKRVLAWLDFIIKQSTLLMWQKVKPLVCSLWEERAISGKEEMHWEEFLGEPSTPSIMIV